MGKVAAIGFDTATPGNVLVRISVDAAAPMTRSTFATLGFQGVTGLAFVQLDDSGTSRDALAPNDADPPRIPLRQGLIGKLTDQGGAIADQVSEGAAALQPVAERPEPEGVCRSGAAARRGRARCRKTVGPAWAPCSTRSWGPTG